MKYQRYEKYKDSGIEWLREVPEDWGIKRLKFLINKNLQYGANESAELDDKELPRYIRITDIENNGTLREDTYRALPVEKATPYLLKEGDMLFARSGATVGKTILYKKSWGECAYAGYLIKASLKQDIINPHYALYCTKAKGYASWVDSMLIQATIQNVSAEKYASFVFPFPQKNEQTAIANFLDRETTRIDTLISKKQKLIELLKEKRTALITRAVTKGLNPDTKMQDSGIEWLGEVPEHWAIMKFKYMLRLSRGVDLSKDNFLEGDYPVMGSNGVIGYHEEFNCKAPGITVGRSGSVGEVNYVNKDYWAHNTTLFLWHNYSNNIKYLYFLLLSLDLKSYAAGSAVGTLNRNIIHRLFITKPPIIEQKNIVVFLDRETDKIDTLISKIEQAIAKHREYKTALISAAVTGKIKVTQS